MRIGWSRAPGGMTAALLMALMAAAVPARAAPEDAARIARSSAFAAVRAALDRGHAAFVEDIVELTEIPAPPFREARRAEAFAARLRAAGLGEVAIDAEGNVTGLRPGTDPKAKPVVISAHLDTVFPEGTEVKVRREGTRLHAPGVGDDTRGLAALIAYARALDAAGVRTRAPILFVGTVGEEGRGDLRGVRHLFTKGRYRGRIGAFFSLDGADPARIVNGGVGSRRYHVVYRGPGGHSFGAFGIVNPLAAMANAVADLYRIEPPKSPKTTYAASVTGGGTSVNAIPAEVFVDVDMRSEDAGALKALEDRFLAIVARSVADENRARSTASGKVSADPQLIGDRPAGATPASAAIVRNAAAAAAALGYTPELGASSTDANLAMSLGIPAVTLGSGGRGGRAHAPDEWIDVEKGESLRGMQVALLALLATAGME